MKGFLVFALTFSLLMGLTACGSWVKDEYSLITPHIEQPLQPEAPDLEEAPPTVTNRTELRGTVLSFIRNWTEQGTILLRDYQGDVSADLQETIRYATQEDPIGAYAVDYMDGEFDGEQSISVNIVFRRSAAEIDAIVTVSGNNSAYTKIQQALDAYDISLTLRIRNYQETDFAQYVRGYCLENPGTLAALPVVSAEVYPKEGETRILELHFSYPASRDEMRLMQASASTILSSASSYIRSGENDREKAELLYRFLTTRFDYTLGEDIPVTPAYSLLCQGIAHSLSFASVFYAECQAADMECLFVEGSKNGEAYFWNLLEIEGEYYHVDLMRSLSEGEQELRLLYSQEMEQAGYIWEEDGYPTTAQMEIEPSQFDPEPVEPTSEPTENTEPSNEPTESTQPETEPSESSSETEPTEFGGTNEP